MKLIFLDLDGVLVTRRLGVFEDKLRDNLKTVVEQTGAKIVLSSDWRRHPFARAEARRELQKVGLDFISFTPCMSQYIAQRPTEIMTWKRDNARNPELENLTHWVAIDDRELLSERHGSFLRGHFVQTHPMQGLTEAAAQECIRILNQPVEAEEAPDPGMSLPALRATAGAGAAGRRSSSVPLGQGPSPTGALGGPGAERLERLLGGGPGPRAANGAPGLGVGPPQSRALSQRATQGQAVQAYGGGSMQGRARGLSVGATSATTPGRLRR
ncbi:unnamed protein product [Polarella glacialis]|uniref:Uncharacterized protein n=1 Tax=Polarella glacialis TaxID=89957 RepID=A0A813DCS9_POLGL|nr:unnamed protein product [Polarella glacialis]CAE8742068.1 unnamed protein product [Polarella glacialis]